MMEIFQEEKVTKNIRNLLRLKKELNYIAMKDIRNLLRLEKKLKQIKREYLEILRILLIMIKKRTTKNQ